MGVLRNICRNSLSGLYEQLHNCFGHSIGRSTEIKPAPLKTKHLSGDLDFFATPPCSPALKSLPVFRAGDGVRADYAPFVAVLFEHQLLSVLVLLFA